LVKSVSRGDVDFAIMWGPTAGFAAKRSPNAFTVVPVQPDRDGPLPFTFAIGMGVKKGNQELQAKLDHFIESKQSDIQKLLEAYGIPQLSIAEARSQAGR
jgi:mxaJ protein